MHKKEVENAVIRKYIVKQIQKGASELNWTEIEIDTVS